MGDEEKGREEEDKKEEEERKKKVLYESQPVNTRSFSHPPRET